MKQSRMKNGGKLCLKKLAPWKKIALGTLRLFLHERNLSAASGFIELSTTLMGPSNATKLVW